MTEDVDWVNNWKQYFHQFTIDDILIIPSWEQVKPEDSGKMIIHIDPGTAFGTGMHETTQLCIRAAENLCETRGSDPGRGLRQRHPWDAGAEVRGGLQCGDRSGSLRHRGYQGKYGGQRDLQRTSIEVMIGNIIDDPAVQDQVGYEKYDVVAANILADVLVPLTPVIVHQMKPGAVYITSGIIEGKEELVAQAARDAGLTVLEINHQGEWASVVARKEQEK